jgi:penicillin-binding protein 1A
MTEHLKTVQAQFFREKKGRRNAPYSNKLSAADVQKFLDRAMKQTDRYRAMSKYATEAEIKEAFNTPREMSVFSWQGEIDTVMTPMDSIRYYKSFLRAGFMSMEPHTGHVKAYVGGPNYHYFQYDMAMMGRRQVGSTIKPFLYTLAMENGFSPCDLVQHVEYTLLDENGIPWTPRNTSDKFLGENVTVEWGLANSDNWITAYLMSKLNPYAFKRLIHSFGVRNQAIVPSVSLCLGPCDISVGEMVSAYTTFPNKGIRVAPMFVTRIEDNEGNILATFSPDMQEVISTNSAYKMIHMMRGVVNGGTGSSIRRLGVTADAAGKTGTTNDNSDGWFIGYTPTLVSGAWVGGDEYDIHFDSMAYGQGARMALPIWAGYMKNVLADENLPYDAEDKFEFPEGYDPCMEEGLEEEIVIETIAEEGIDNLFE